MDGLSDFLSGERLADLCQSRWAPGDPLPPSGSVYVKADYTRDFFDAVRDVGQSYTLLTHNSDRCATPDDLARIPGNIAKWYAQNLCLSDPRCEAVPIGIANSRWPHGDIDLWRAALSIPRTLHNWAYVNFTVATNAAQRQPCLDRFQDQYWVTIRSGITPQEYAADLRCHRFVVCPEGNGPDTHRVWEALYMGATPICLRSKAMSHFADLPILFVNDWWQVTPGYLEMADTMLLEKHTQRLHLSYWQKQLH
jgi:hypothetical protein